MLSRPLLYLSLYLKCHRDLYYEHLQRIRTDGAWEEWVQFFLEGVIEVAQSATDTTRRIVEPIERDRQRVHGLAVPQARPRASTISPFGRRSSRSRGPRVSSVSANQQSPRLSRISRGTPSSPRSQAASAGRSTSTANISHCSTTAPSGGHTARPRRSAAVFLTGRPHCRFWAESKSGRAWRDPVPVVLRLRARALLLAIGPVARCGLNRGRPVA